MVDQEFFEPSGVLLAPGRARAGFLLVLASMAPRRLFFLHASRPSGEKGGARTARDHSLVRLRLCASGMVVHSKSRLAGRQIGSWHRINFGKTCLALKDTGATLPGGRLRSSTCPRFAINLAGPTVRHASSGRSKRRPARLALRPHD